MGGRGSSNINRKNKYYRGNMVLGEQWWWKGPKCIWQGVNIELKDKQGECPSLFMPIGRQGNVRGRQHPLSVWSSHISEQPPKQARSKSIHLSAWFYLVSFCIILQFNSSRGFISISRLSCWMIINSHFNDSCAGQRALCDRATGHPPLSNHVMVYLIVCGSTFTWSVIAMDPCFGCKVMSALI